MATFEVKMPKVGESITEGTIISWSVKVGDQIKEDDILFEVSTAKVSAEIPSPVAGRITEIKYKEGDTVSVGETVVIVDLETPQSQPATASTNQPEVKQEQPEQTTGKDKQPADGNTGRWYSPVVTQLAQQAGISQEELDTITGTGYQGRVSKKDIQQYITKKQQQQPAAQENQPAATQPDTPKQPAAAPPKEEKTTGKEVKTDTGDQVIEMDPVRRIIADRMVASKKISPHVTTVVEADVTRLVQWRSRTKDSFQQREGFPLTFMPAITEAAAKALVDYPQVNASVDGYKIIIKKQINIGIAVALDNGNLIVPVIHDAGNMNINGLAIAIDTVAHKARGGKLTPHDIEGGTFTITNFGSFKNLFGVPIINQPEVAILAVGFIEKKPAVISTPDGDAIAIRHKMYLSLSYDHRVVDGALGGAFLRRIADYLENWDQ